MTHHTLCGRSESSVDDRHGVNYFEGHFCVIRRSPSLQRLSSLLFYIAYGAWLIWRFSETTLYAVLPGNPLGSWIHLAVFGILVVSCTLSFEVDKYLPMLILSLVVAVGIKLATSNFCFIDMAIIFYAGRQKPFQIIATMSVVIISIMCCVTVILSLTGIIENYPFTATRANDSSIRWGLGFRYCTYLSHFVLSIVLLLLYVYRGKLHLGLYLLVIVINCIVFYLTKSKNSFILVFLVLGLSLFLRWPKSERFICPLALMSKYSFIAITILWFLMAGLYDNSSSAWNSINAASNSRVTSAHNSLVRYGVTLFGQDVEWVGNAISLEDDSVSRVDANPDGDINFVDCSYINIAISQGVIALIAIIAGFTLVGDHALKNRDGWLALILLAIAVHSAFDPQLLNLVYTTFLFLAWNSLAETVGDFAHRLRIRVTRA